MKYCSLSYKQFAWGALIIFALCGCSRNKDFYKESDGEENNRPSIDELFDFNTQHSCYVDFDYCLKNYVIIFELYAEDPLIESDGYYMKKDIEAVYRASTDENGKFKSDITLPAYMKEAWLYSDFLGVTTCVKLDIINQSLNFNRDNYLKEARGSSSRATVANGYTYPDEFRILGNWIDVWGTPEYLLNQKLPSADILYRMKKIYSSVNSEKIGNAHPGLLEENVPVDLKIKKATKVYLTFINTTATIQNTVGYFTYKTGTIPNVDEIQKIIAFPHTSPYYNNKMNRFGALMGGDRIQLKYWNGEKFLDEFPEGVSIGWFMIRMGYNHANGNITSKGRNIHYSTTSLNSDKKRHVVALHDNSEKLVSIGFEDQIEPYTDWNYADAVFSFEYEVDGAIDDLPSLPDDDKKPGPDDNFVACSGTIVFEDQWPAQGDYDMNDVAVYYESKRYKNLVSNKVIKCVDKFTVINESNSASYQNGFGYQFSSLDKGDIKSVLIEGVTKSSYMENQDLEPGQSHPTIILFDNAKSVIGKTITVTVEFKGEIAEGLLNAPCNPFIFIQNDRGRELHLATIPSTTANYLPTDKASESNWGKETDMTNSEKHIYYVAEDLMPYALYVSGIKFVLPDERQKITDAYPKFSSWVSSQGTTNKDWYKNK